MAATWADEAAEAEGRRRHYEQFPEQFPNPLDNPPKSFTQVLGWADSARIRPTREATKAARAALSSVATLREALHVIGPSDADIHNAEKNMEDEYLL